MDKESLISRHRKITDELNIISFLLKDAPKPKKYEHIYNDYLQMRERGLKVKEDTDTSPVRIMIMETREYKIDELNQNKLNFV